ncbi:hypothetical protein SUDANB145_07163 (plasmid) [Streptomyces sp. enrichment culture]|uniref:hypothetical protein n=1 Tax=Streptomyces sp. enrichment culture TaxID=1795815 RepID=UPI003F57E7C2
MSIRIELSDVRAADRLVEALYVASGTRPHSPQAVEWLALAGQLEREIDQLPPTYPPRERQRHLQAVDEARHDRAS